MKKTYDFCMVLALILTAFLLAMNGIRRNDEALASRIAPEILRFHVLANSNSAEDQALKLAVKDLLLEEIRAGVDSRSDKDMVEQYVLDNKSTLERIAEEFIAECGFDYPAKIALETCEFPQKTYGDMTFPAGTYEAVRVIIGDGGGENFWCVLYPSLCYLDSTYAIVPDDSRETLKALLPEDDFHALLTSNKYKTEQDSLLPRITIRFKLADLFSSL